MGRETVGQNIVDRIQLVETLSSEIQGSDRAKYSSVYEGLPFANIFQPRHSDLE